MYQALRWKQILYATIFRTTLSYIIWFFKYYVWSGVNKALHNKSMLPRWAVRKNVVVGFFCFVFNRGGINTRMSSSWNFPSWAEPSWKVSEPSRAKLGTSIFELKPRCTFFLNIAFLAPNFFVCLKISHFKKKKYYSP